MIYSEIKCSCGNLAIVRRLLLLRREVTCCGCKRKYRSGFIGHLKDGLLSREADRLRGMINRCYNKDCEAYKNYGARGIRVCDRWLESFDNFLYDMGVPNKGLSIDRIDNDGNYTPDNCRWADRKTQNNNKRQRKKSAI